MCGRYTLVCSGDEMADEFGVDVPPEYVPRYNIAPSQPVAVIGSGKDGGSRLAFLRWGLVPFWADSPRAVPNAINARAESVLRKPAFRDSFMHRRCLLPADGFYEWRRSGKSKQPFRFHRSDDRPFTFAGVWDRWRGPDGEQLFSCAIITTAANAVVGPIHDRMPVVIVPEDRAAWLDPATPADALAALMASRDYESMNAYAVGSYVNSAANDSLECIAPAEPQP